MTEPTHVWINGECVDVSFDWRHTHHKVPLSPDGCVVKYASFPAATDPKLEWILLGIDWWEPPPVYWVEMSLSGGETKSRIDRDVREWPLLEFTSRHLPFRFMSPIHIGNGESLRLHVHDAQHHDKGREARLMEHLSFEILEKTRGGR